MRPRPTCGPCSRRSFWSMRSSPISSSRSSECSPPVGATSMRGWRLRKGFLTVPVRGSSGMVPDLLALVLLLGITAYSVAGGVDFGAGIWDLLAGNSARGRDARALIDHAMAPVWEVNNVWLVLSIVVCWTAFPALFETAFLSLYPLFTLALIGLILRGAFFAFRHVARDGRGRRVADIVFGASSVLTPFFF